MPTPHIAAEPGDFADTVLLPGDPRRAAWIAATFLDDAREVTAVRNIVGFTGTWEGTPVSVMGTGMGIPSASIYTTELVTQFGVRRLVRVGSCGALRPEVALHDLVIALGASTDSQVNRRRCLGLDFAALATFGLVRGIVDAAASAGVPHHVGNVFSSDLFYPPVADDPLFATLRGLGVLAVEMEAAGIYGVAAQYGAEAVTVCTVSDQLVHEQALSAEERERSFRAMVEVTLRGVLGDATEGAPVRDAAGR